MTHPNASTAAAEVIADELVRGGVTDVVLAPGSRSAALAIAFLRHPRIQVTVHIDERSAAFFALGMGKASGRPTAVVTTSGSAVANLLPAVVEADAAGVPLLLLTADRPPELHGVGANQTITQVGIFGDRVRWSAVLGPPEHRADAPGWWRSLVSRAIDEAATGPVHLNLPFREPLVPETDDGRDADEPFVYDTDGRSGGARWSPSTRLPLPTARLDARWSEPERGVVVAGEIPGSPIESVGRLAAALGWPLIAEPTAGGRPPQTISTAHHLLTDPRICRELRPEVAIVLGRATLSRPVSRFLRDVPTLVVDPRRANPSRDAEELMAAWPVVDAIGDRSGEWRRRWLQVEAAGRSALDAALDQGGVSEPRIARDVAAAVPAGGTLVVASSMPIRDLDMTMSPGDVRVVSNRGASGIDGFVSTAEGVAAASDGPVVALGGDLAYLHDANGFLADPLPDVVHVVVNNDGGGIFSFLPQVRQADVFERAFGTPHGRRFEHLAAFHGVRHAIVEEPRRQVAAALDDGGTWILEARTERTANPGIHRDLTDRVVAAALASLEG